MKTLPLTVRLMDGGRHEPATWAGVLPDFRMRTDGD